jgi:hypothetical protein
VIQLAIWVAAHWVTKPYDGQSLPADCTSARTAQGCEDRAEVILRPLGESLAANELTQSCGVHRVEAELLERVRRKVADRLRGHNGGRLPPAELYQRAVAVLGSAARSAGRPVEKHGAEAGVRTSRSSCERECGLTDPTSTRTACSGTHQYTITPDAVGG